MAYTLNGIGTTFYGERDLRSDHSYITTEWIVIFYIPIIPIRSFRLRGGGTVPPSWSIGINLGSEHYAVLETTFPNWRQVLCVYGFVLLSSALAAAAIFGTIYGSLFLADRSIVAAWAFGILFPASIGWPPFVLPKLLRDRAERRNRVNGH